MTSTTFTNITIVTPSTMTVISTSTPLTNSTASEVTFETQATTHESANTTSLSAVTLPASTVLNNETSTIQRPSNIAPSANATSYTTASGVSTSTMQSSGATVSTMLTTIKTTTKVSIATAAPALNFNVTFRIINKNFSTSLNDKTSPEFRNLRDEVIKALDDAYNCSTCSLRSLYKGSEVQQFRQGSVIAEARSSFKTDTDITQATVKSQFDKAVKNNTINNLRIKDLHVNEIQSIASTTTTPQAPVVPGWGIALLVLVCIILLIIIIIFLLLIIIYLCRRRSRGQFELFGSRGSYYPMADRNDYPQYTTHSRFIAPNGKQNPNNQVSGNGTNVYSYTNHAVESDNL
ncbi:mucin-1-like [Carcharodon carcharias]|uniref:mucin-1-like n=1 Tax=Carcharodon carcharias TaxID=13397 RepID=UPI001B7F6C37|nr:mucin-1-like [Carcharodon carcharias]